MGTNVYIRLQIFYLAGGRELCGMRPRTTN